jgi:hypothetical protein
MIIKANLKKWIDLYRPNIDKDAPAMMALGMTKRIVGRSSIPGADILYTMEVHRQEVNCCDKSDAVKKGDNENCK